MKHLKRIDEFRIVKESNSFDKLQGDVDSYLAYLTDDGFKIDLGGSQLVGKPIRNNYYIRIWKQKDTSKPYTFINCVEFKWSDIEEEVLRFISIIEESWGIDYLYAIIKKQEETSDRRLFKKEELLNIGDFNLKSFVIGLVKDVEDLKD